MADAHGLHKKHSLKAHVKEFRFPPIRDALVVGRNSPVGCVALRRAIALLVSTPFEHIELPDGVVSDVLVRAAILQRIPKEKLLAFMDRYVTPLMQPEEVLHLDLDVEVILEVENL